jgi:CheY-like chemotaxis protein
VPSSPNIRILSISDDTGLRSTREDILRKDGYEIVSISSDELLSVFQIRSFDVAVMCHSVAPHRAMGLVDRLRRYNPNIRLLRVNPRLHRIDPFYDIDSEVLAGPGALQKAVKTLLNRNVATSAAEPKPAGRDEYCGPFAEFLWTNKHAS